MKTPAKFILGLLLPAIQATPTWAQVDGAVDADPVEAAKTIDISQIASGGPGCPGGGALDIYRSDTSGRVMVFLPEMSVEVGERRIDRKACGLSLSVSLPADQRLVLGQPAVFGAADLEEGASATALAEVFLAGSTGPQIEAKISGVENDGRTYFYERAEDEVRSECGAQVNVRANVSLLGLKGSSVSGGTARLDGAALTLKTESCTIE